MKLEKYIPLEILNNELKKYKKEIELFFEENKDSFIYGQKRDNCGVIAADFLMFMKDRDIDIKRVNGNFVNDIGVYTKLDFYKEEIGQMKQLNLNPDILEDRFEFCNILNLHERQKRIPHYWNVDENGLIIDLSGYSQFVKKGLSKDIKKERYENKEEPSIKKEKKIKLKF